MYAKNYESWLQSYCNNNEPLTFYWATLYTAIVAWHLGVSLRLYSNSKDKEWLTISLTSLYFPPVIFEQRKTDVNIIIMIGRLDEFVKSLGL